MTRDNQNHRYAISLHAVKMVFPLVIAYVHSPRDSRSPRFPEVFLDKVP